MPAAAATEDPADDSDARPPRFLSAPAHWPRDLSDTEEEEGPMTPESVVHIKKGSVDAHPPLSILVRQQEAFKHSSDEKHVRFTEEAPRVYHYPPAEPKKPKDTTPRLQLAWK